MSSLQLLVPLTVDTEEMRWCLALEVPTAELCRFSKFPLKWIRYLAFTLLGCEGHLSKSTSGPPVDYEFSPANDEGFKGKYYYVAKGPFLLLDLYALDDRYSDSGVSTKSSQRDFRAEIVERDEECIITGYGFEHSIACHIIPRSKGDEYIRRLSTWRTNEELIMTDICDCRNGFLMEPLCHNLFDSMTIALLPIPNFALVASDISVPVDSPATPEAFLVIQWLTSKRPGALELYDRPHGKIHPRPVDSSKLEQWPPSFILDVAYGVAAFRKWGVPGFTEEFMRASFSHYYDDGEHDFTDGENSRVGKKPTHGRTLGIEKAKKERAERATERAARRGQQNDAFDLVTRLWEFTARQGGSFRARTEAIPQTDTDNDKLAREKVSTWLETTTS